MNSLNNINEDRAKKIVEEIIRKSKVIIFIWKVEKGWPIEFVSSNISQFGYTEEDFLSKQLVYEDIIHPVDLNNMKSRIKQLQEQNKMELELEYRIRKKNGETCWVQDLTSIIKNQNGDITHYQGMIFDITERKEMERALKQKDELLEGFAEASNSGFDDCHKERTWSVEEKSIIQVAAASIGGAMIRSKMEEDLEKMVGDRTRDLIFALEKINQTQQKLVEQEKMASLGNLVAGIAHEINTPIGIGVTAISHLLNSSNDLDKLLQEGKMKKSDLVKYISTVKESSNMVYSNLNRASELIKGFKQIAVDRSSEILRKFNMKDYLEELITSLRPQLKNRKQKVIVNCPDSYEVYSNPGAYSQIITNLILNSLLHGYDSHDDVGKIEITIKEKEGKLIIHYIDDGKGMPLEVKEKIFEPFYTTNRGNGGTGLGMHIVYNLVTQSLGGTIHCESEEGIGTNFDIVIPIDNVE